jgi:hypothetical protein
MSFGLPFFGSRWPVIVGFLLLALNRPLHADPPERMAVDKDRAIFGRIEDEKPVASQAVNPDEFAAYNEILTFANQFTAADLQSAARRDLAFKDLFHPIRKDYRLDLVYFEGRLQRLRSVGPTRPLREAGITTLYEGWMFPKGEPNPIAFLCTELPEGLSAQKDVAKEKLDRWVGFAGYSFKLIVYESAEVQPNDPMRGKPRRAPLLMGKAPTLIGKPADETGAMWHNTFLPIVLAAIGSLALAVFGLAMWYKKGDAYLKQAIDRRLESNPF